MKEEQELTTVTAQIEYICGSLRTAHREIDLTKEELEKFELMSLEEQKEYLEEEGEIVIDDFRIEDFGETMDIDY